MMSKANDWYYKWLKELILRSKLEEKIYIQKQEKKAHWLWEFETFIGRPVGRLWTTSTVPDRTEHVILASKQEKLVWTHHFK